MSDIFLSYSSKDITRAKQLAEALTRQGWRVWWDRSILPGKIFDRVIEAELAATRCVIVLWSNDSVESSWVRAEAEVAMKKGQLIPALLEEVNIPLVFRQFQAASLSDWDGDIGHAGFQQLLNAISALLPRPDVIETAPSPAPRTTQPPPELPAASVSIETEDASAEATPQTIPSDKHSHSRLNIAAWALVFILAGALVYSIFYSNNQTVPPVVTTQSAEPQTPPTTADTPRVTDQNKDAQSEQLETAQTPDLPQPEPAPAQTIPTEPIKTPAPSPAKPKPTPVLPRTVDTSEHTQQSSPPQIASSTTPSAKAAAPLAILIVSWAMPSDKGVASITRIQDFSSKVATTLSTALQDVLNSPVNFDYLYPSQQEYYRLLKDKDGYAEYQTLCNTHKATLVVSGFIQGAKFVSASYGYELTRDPIFSVFDCMAEKKVTQSYKIAESNQDGFPYETSIRKTFREFVEHKATLSNY